MTVTYTAQDQISKPLACSYKKQLTMSVNGPQRQDFSFLGFIHTSEEN